MVLSDTIHGRKYLQQLVTHHTSGQMKIAPEHTEDRILSLMGKPSADRLMNFTQLFNEITQEANKEQYLTYYLIAAHPGCSDQDMRNLKRFATHKLHISPEQVQIFTPTPSTYSSVMYYTGMDPFTHKPIFVERNLKKKQRQKDVLVTKPGLPSPQLRPQHKLSSIRTKRSSRVRPK
jgi:radical SAM superfamily enzyme YgiQ (UPF0313 family)